MENIEALKALYGPTEREREIMRLQSRVRLLQSQVEIACYESRPAKHNLLRRAQDQLRALLEAQI